MMVASSRDLSNRFFFKLSPLHQILVNLLLPSIVTMVSGPTPSASMFDDISLSTPEMIKRAGYSVEIHQVITFDGYVLEMHRIPKNKSGQSATRNYPVLLHHGIIGSSADWVLGGPNTSLAFQLVDSGYDVWLANCRGNTYCVKHKKLSTKSNEFWNFSMHEIGIYDLPAEIDYILKSTQALQLHYIGFSMGTTVFYIMASERPKYQLKIREQISLAPVAFLGNTRSCLKYFAPHAKTLNAIFQVMMKGRFMPHSKLHSFLASTLCRERMTQKLICQKYIIFAACGTDPDHFDTQLIPLIMGHVPAGTSSKLATHFAQFMITGTFKRYDYGPTKNQKYYNSTIPPDYDLRSIQVPVSLIYGENDILADIKDVLKLSRELPRLMNFVRVDNDYCNHVDFLWSKLVKPLVNDPVCGILAKTDDPAFEYTGRPVCTVEDSADGGRRRGPTAPEPETGAPTALLVDDDGEYDRDRVRGIGYLARNLDAAIDDSMPRGLRSEADVELFRREKDAQKLLFGNLLGLVEKFESGYGQLRDFAAQRRVGGSNGTVARAVADTAHATENNVRNAVNRGIENAGRAVNGALNAAENFVESGLTTAERAVRTNVVDRVDGLVDAAFGGLRTLRFW